MISSELGEGDLFGNMVSYLEMVRLMHDGSGWWLTVEFFENFTCMVIISYLFTGLAPPSTDSEKLNILT
jgi:hypothetical protein